jgi:hypothetical protein
MISDSVSAEIGATRVGDGLEDRISLLVHRLNSRFTQIANQLLQTRDINMYDSRILLFLLERNEMRVGELVDAMALVRVRALLNKAYAILSASHIEPDEALKPKNGKKGRGAVRSAGLSRSGVIAVGVKSGRA